MFVQVVNFNDNPVTLGITINGLDPNVNLAGSIKTVLTCTNVRDENSFKEPNKV